MSDLIRNALRRKLAAAEAAYDLERIELLRARMGIAARQEESAAAKIDDDKTPKRGRPRKSLFAPEATDEVSENREEAE